jgi:beta-galactosidase
LIQLKDRRLTKTKLVFTFFVIVIAALSKAQSHTFKLSGDYFLLDGKPFQIISGEMHFTRIPRECWHDRLKMVKAMGLNTVCTYVFWNVEEPEKGKFNFRGNADVASFVRAAEQEGLWVIIRPSAYACAEWEFGGYPYWLLKEQGLKVRTRDRKFLQLMKDYYKQLGKQLVTLQVTHGGPILMVQVENEYGSYGADKEYMKTNVRMMREAGFDVPFYTLDGIDMVARGCVEDALPAVDGSVDIQRIKEVIRDNHHGHGPFFIGEWYPGWFDDWGEPFRSVPVKECAEQLDSVLSHGLSVNIYVAHGGTTRSFMNGANYSSNSLYAPQISSYDYDAPIDEAGNPTAKFYALRDVIAKYLPKSLKLPYVPKAKPAISIPKFKLEQGVDIIHNLPEPIFSVRPATFEDLDQAYGYLLYRTKIKGPVSGNLEIIHMRDYGIIFVNGERVRILDRRHGQETCDIVLPSSENTLDIFVENLGRINYGKYVNDNRKGITDKVLLNGQEISEWQIYRFPFDEPPQISSRLNSNDVSDYPVIREGCFVLEKVGDTYVDMRDWGKGHVWINGHNLGRYWYVGPQQTIYVPSVWLKKGENKITVFEELKTEENEINFIDRAILNEVRN